MKKPIGTAELLVLVAHVLIGGWAFLTLLEPGRTIDMMRFFVSCL
ncbi:MAG TPA: hypothetical protein VGU61_20255 [Noviherbaspirillum sp.]|jgi:hypothetical protein|nr:hypothetical protein [Noviherbaspirillum sp.]HEV2612607.1 hypothetical protein [Noviherbaspirillum sp.]